MLEHVRTSIQSMKILFSLKDEIVFNYLKSKGAKRNKLIKECLFSVNFNTINVASGLKPMQQQQRIEIVHNILDSI